MAGKVVAKIELDNDQLTALSRACDKFIMGFGPKATPSESLAIKQIERQILKHLLNK